MKPAFVVWAMVASTLWSALAWGTTGGPSYVTDVRYDPDVRRVYYVRTEFCECETPPMVAMFPLGTSQERIARRVTNPTKGQWEAERARWSRWAQRLEAMPHVRATIGQPATLRSLGFRTESYASEVWGAVERHLSLVEVRSGDLVGRARVTSYGNRRIRVSNLYDVPGGRRVAILRARGIPVEGGYDSDTVVLLAPDTTVVERRSPRVTSDCLL